MTDWFVSRHQATMEWAKGQHIAANFVSHLDIAKVQQNDRVYGTLPIQLVAEVCAKGARYFHVILDLPAEHRGKELTMVDLQRFGIRLQEFMAKEILDGR
ncbi:CRISPR-associated protein Csx16 [Donghicola mangrovi]|uniref:CRISPR-associated protein Csx16 n=1 Tax=Donghicola mangrovi TaxID=2729614 RepID=A0A850Q2J4_9RHOB|nr:CRISPR-associated protein Csx16 [Donghicola mangrovi]NVO23316.1 CRISPR-associated protein Csx16 [Donghicola mangrovi]